MLLELFQELFQQDIPNRGLVMHKEVFHIELVAIPRTEVPLCIGALAIGEEDPVRISRIPTDTPAKPWRAAYLTLLSMVRCSDVA